MPIPVPPNGVMQVAIHGVNQDVPWACIMHLKALHTGAPSSADAIAMATVVFDQWAGSVLPQQSNQITLERVDLEWSDGAGGFVEGAYANPAVGGDSGAYLDASVSVVWSWRAATHWRGGHPRTYVPGVSQDRLDSVNAFTTATVSAFQGAGDAFRNAVNASTPGGFSNVTLGCLRRFADRGSLARPKVYLDPPVFIPFTGLITRQHIGSQRRRLQRF